MSVKIFKRLLVIIGLTGCLSPSTAQCNRLFGAWSFLDDQQHYVEMYLNSERISFFHEIDGNFHGNMQFTIRDDSLFFNNMSYAIDFENDYTVLLVNSSHHLTLHKINPPIISGKTNTINPFYLRRCNYLVNQGIITMTEAVDYLSKSKSKIKRKGPKEELIL